MDRRHQVFVSSTFLDLRDERQAVIQALLELDCIPAGMELFPASDETAKQLIKRVIEGCDYYVVIVGGRYGYVDADGLSYTEWEYDTAVSLDIPVLGFVHENPAQIVADKTEMDAGARAKLAAFRDKVEKRHRKTYRNADDLAGKVSRAMVQTMKLQPRDGWVPGRYASSPERINELRTRIDELERQLKDARIKPPVEAKGLASGDETHEVWFDAYGGKVGSCVFTWDDLIGTLGPLMLNEADEDRLKKALSEKIEDVAVERYAKVRDEDFQTVKVQLLALGIVQQSDRKRTASDKGTYWTLTAYGRHYTMTLRAIRSGTEPNAGRSGTGPTEE